MDPLGTNPFQILTFIVAPAILTNGSSVMALSVSNRFARAIDRARTLSRELEAKQDTQDPRTPLLERQLSLTGKRVLLLVRALTAFYLSVGCFAAASLISLLGAVLFIAHQDLLRQVFLAIGLCAGAIGVGGLVCGSGILVYETRTALRTLVEETELMLKGSGKQAGP